jgi:hypothetical protein
VTITHVEYDHTPNRAATEATKHANQEQRLPEIEQESNRQRQVDAPADMPADRPATTKPEGTKKPK